MINPGRGTQWLAWTAVVTVVVAVWYYVELRSAPPPPPKVELPYSAAK